MTDMNYNDLTYWIAVAHLKGWNVERINRMAVAVLHENEMKWADFFELESAGWSELFAFTEKELVDLESAKKVLPHASFTAEKLQNAGIDIIPVDRSDYPVVLKENLKLKSPPVLYIKGRKSLLDEEAVAIVGSRNAGSAALEFTDFIAKKSVKEEKVVVSGFAKGVDKQALDSTLKAYGKSIIVLPQGILTFQTGFRQYYEHIVNGNVLVLSTFQPGAGWDVGLAMARNAYIYGLAKEIFVAESDDKGGTWNGALGGLKMKRKVYVRMPEPKEKNANLKLIELGAVGVDKEGNVVEKVQKKVKQEYLFDQLAETAVGEAKAEYNKELTPEEKILDLLTKGSYTAKEIITMLKLDWSSAKVAAFLKKNPDVRIEKSKVSKYTMQENETPTLFV